LAASIVAKVRHDSDESDTEESDVYDDDLEVTGFAVASNRRNADFHALFPRVDEGDYLIEGEQTKGHADQRLWLCPVKGYPRPGSTIRVGKPHLLSCQHLWLGDGCKSSSTLLMQLVIPFSDIKLIERKNTALVIPNAIGISTRTEKYTFASFISRDTTFDVMSNIWRLCNPGAVMSTTSIVPSRPASIVQPEVAETGHSPTSCHCTHYAETALDTVLGSTPEKVYNLMCTSEWFKTWLVEDQKLKGESCMDWLIRTGNVGLALRRCLDADNVVHQTPQRFHRSQADKVPHCRRARPFPT
jgi:hypothetical protein